jgi:hypothetical protein
METTILFAKSTNVPEMTATEGSPRINGLKGQGSIDVTMTWTNHLDLKSSQVDESNFNELDIRPAYSDLFKRDSREMGRELAKGGLNGHLKCPAFKDFFYNCYVLLFPYDLSLRFDPETQSFTILDSSVSLNSEMILVRWGQQYVDTRVVISLNPYMLFDVAVDILLEVGPAFLHATEPRLRRLRPIPGAFNIGRWFRPIDFTFELDLSDGDVELRKGDPLLYLRFITPSNESIKLYQQPFNEEYSFRALECAEIARNKSNPGNNAAQLNKYYQALDKVKSR